MAAHWNLSAWQIGSGRYHAVLDILHTARSQLACVRHSTGTHMEGSIPKNTVVLSWTGYKHPPMQLRGTLIGSNQLMVQDSRKGMDFSACGPVETLTLAFARDELLRRLGQLWQADPVRIFQGSVFFENEDAGPLLARRMKDHLEEAIADRNHLRSPVEVSALETECVESLLASLSEPRPPQAGIARRWIARRAAGILRERCRENLSISDLCQAVGASRRTLHLGFLELYGLPPMRFLRLLRLSGVRRDLARAKTGNAPITEIATAWGFNHLGRFAACYREFFGTPPSAALSKDSRSKPEKER